MNRPRLATISLLVALLSAPGVLAGEIHSNGAGGGLWSQATTWRGGTVPTTQDVVVIAAGDTVTFDLDHDATPSCAELAIDPGAVLTFKADLPRCMLNVAGPIESFGTIRADMTASAGIAGIRLSSDAPEKRVIRFRERGALLLFGARDLAEDQRNVLIISGAPQPPATPAADGTPPPPPEPQPGRIELIRRCMLDVQYAQFQDITLTASNIDNTGFSPNERVNVVGCRFIGQARLAVYSCDTPVVTDNVFVTSVKFTSAALELNSSPVAEVKNNYAAGPYAYGIYGAAQTDTSLIGNTVENCAAGIYWYGTALMARGNTVRACPLGVTLTSMSGTLEDLTLDAVPLGVHVPNATAQLVNLKFVNPPENATPIRLTGGTVRLLNTNLSPEQIDTTGAAATVKVEAMEYLVVGVKGNRTPQTQVSVRTEGTPFAVDGAPDANVRNSPAMVLSNGLTPLPRSPRVLVVSSWSMDGSRTITPAPRYVVSAWEPPTPDKPLVAERAAATVQPDASWYCDPDTPVELFKPTVELTLR